MVFLILWRWAKCKRSLLRDGLTLNGLERFCSFEPYFVFGLLLLLLVGGFICVGGGSGF